MDMSRRKLTISCVLTLAIATQACGQSNSAAQTKLAAEAAAPAPSSEAASPAERAHDPHYVIGDDDMLSINVWKEQDLTQSLPVRSDGNISMPLIGEIQAAGRTPLQLETEIAERLRTYITQPEVTVMVVKMNSRKYNILGRVSKPGSYTLSSPKTVLDAIADAGGFQDFAKVKAIYVLRHQANGTDVRLPFNYKAVIRGEHPEQNVTLEPHDTIVVP